VGGNYPNGICGCITPASATMYGTVRGTQYGYSIYEFQVYAS